MNAPWVLRFWERGLLPAAHQLCCCHNPNAAAMGLVFPLQAADVRHAVGGAALVHPGAPGEGGRAARHVSRSPLWCLPPRHAAIWLRDKRTTKLDTQLHGLAPETSEQSIQTSCSDTTSPAIRPVLLLSVLSAHLTSFLLSASPFFLPRVRPPHVCCANCASYPHFAVALTLH